MELKKFRGIKLDICSLTMTRFEGYGIAVLSINIFIKGAACDIGLGVWNLFNIHYSINRLNGGEIRRVYLVLFGIGGNIWQKVIKEPNYFCDSCEARITAKEKKINDGLCESCADVKYFK